MNRSTDIAEISKALVAAQLEMTNPAFDSTNPHFKSKFASLAAIRNTVVPVLTKHGISMTQDLATVDGGVACTTILTHASGQYMEFGPLVMPATKPDAQGVGSASTYCKRYALQAVCGVVGDEDDDGNGAVTEPKESDKRWDSRPANQGKPPVNGSKKEKSPPPDTSRYDKAAKLINVAKDAKELDDLLTYAKTVFEPAQVATLELSARQRLHEINDELEKAEI